MHVANKCLDLNRIFVSRKYCVCLCMSIYRTKTSGNIVSIFGITCNCLYILMYIIKTVSYRIAKRFTILISVEYNVRFIKV